jgi:hypothetical protein
MFEFSSKIGNGSLITGDAGQLLNPKYVESSIAMIQKLYSTIYNKADFFEAARLYG